MILKKQPHKPGSAVQRFGDWRKGEPSVIIDNQKWVSMGMPFAVKLNFELQEADYEDKM